MGEINFNLPAQSIVNFCRGLNPWPVAFVILNRQTDEKLKVFSAKINEDINDKLHETCYEAGEIVTADSKNGLIIKCADGFVLLDEIQAAGKKRMNSKDYLRGNKII